MEYQRGTSKNKLLHRNPYSAQATSSHAQATFSHIQATSSHEDDYFKWQKCNTNTDVIQIIHRHYSADVIQEIKDNLDNVKTVFNNSKKSRWKGKRKLKKTTIPNYQNNYKCIVGLVSLVENLESILSKTEINTQAKLKNNLKLRDDEIEKSKKEIEHNMKEKFDALENNYRQTCLNKSELQKEVVKQTKLLNDKNTKLHQFQKEIDRLNIELSQRDYEINDLKAALSKQDSELGHWKAELSKRNSEIDHWNNELFKRDSEIDHSKNELSKRDSEIDHWKTEMSKRDSEIDQMRNMTKQEINKLNNMILEKDNEIASLKEVYKITSDDLERADKAKRHFENQFKQKEKQYHQLAQKDATVKNLLRMKEQECKEWAEKYTAMETNQRKAERHIQDISMKLAAEMSTKLSADERAVENVSIKNRPMNVAEEYQMVCSNQWLDAKGAVDESAPNVPDYQRLQLLCHIIEVAESETQMVKKEIFDSLHSQMYDPINFIFGQKLVGTQTSIAGSNQNNHHTALKEKKVPTEFSNMLGDQLKLSSDNVNIHKLIQQVHLKLNNMDQQPIKEIWDKSKENQQVKVYLDSVVRIIWKMVIQRPAMEFKQSDNFRGENFQEVFWNSDAVQNHVVITVYPMLYHGESLMAKGKVLLLDRKKLI